MISGLFLVETTELEGVATYVTEYFTVIFDAAKSTLKSLVILVPQSIQSSSLRKGRYIKHHKPAK
jgi:hypothetical protein